MCNILVMQKLRDFLSENNIARRDFAAQIGVDQSVLSRFCNDQARPGLETAVRIERATGGIIPASAWIPEPEPTPTPDEDAA
jgi:transcriptional regulator with XRE-family HTH domain